MKNSIKSFVIAALPNTLIGAILILGLYFVVLRSFGPGFGLIPGDIGDARFNNFVLEHFYQWSMGQQKSFWDAPIFYPFPKTIAFSDALLGSGPFYALLRWAGFSREAAFQGWYVCGYILNYLAAAYVLSRLKMHPLAISCGAFFFTFGLPMLAQNGHPQLIYRFGVPLVCYFLWKFTQRPQLATLTILGFWFVWQLYLTIYIGFFLFLLVAPLFFLLPLSGSGSMSISVKEEKYGGYFRTSRENNPHIYGLPQQLPKNRGSKRSFSKYLLYWPQKIKVAWSNATNYQKAANISVAIGLAYLVFSLISPYRWVSIHYGFVRSWKETASFLPMLQSYFIADKAPLWQPVSRIFSDFPARNEHQLFAGVAIFLLILIGIAWKKPSRNRQFADLHLISLCFLVAITLEINGLSFYKFLFALPGFNSIRAISRISLVMMWPLAIFAAHVIDQLIAGSTNKIPLKYAAYLCFALMALESILFTQVTFSKADAISRINDLRNQLPKSISSDAILFFASNPKSAWVATEIDAMLLGQESGISVLNGYSGNFPPGYSQGITVSCKQMKPKIASYLKFKGEISEQNYHLIASKVIPIGFTDCDSR